MNAPEGDGPHSEHAVPWQRFTGTNGDVLRLVRFAETSVLPFLASRGLDVTGANRIRNACNIVRRREDTYKRRTGGELLTVAYPTHALRSLFDAALITWTATHPDYRRRVEPFATASLQQLLRGDDDPRASKSTYARDIQFELLTGATLVWSGLEATPAEPDFHSTLMGERIGIAAKRVTRLSIGAVHDRLRKARRQLKREKLRGFASISIDPWLVDLDGNSADTLGASFDSLADDVYTELEKASKDVLLIGAFLCGTSISTAPNNPLHLRVRVAMKLVSYDWGDDVSRDLNRRLAVGIGNRYQNALRRFMHDVF